MALKKIGVIRGVTDGKFKPVGGTEKDIRGIAAIKFNPDIVTATSEGDNDIYSLSSRVKSIKFTFEHAVLDLDTLSAITGWTLTAGGSGSSETQTLDIDSDTFPYFSFECRSTNLIDSLDSTGDAIADAHFKIYKAKITGGLNVELKDEGHWQVSFEALAIPDSSSSGKIASIIFYETATNISL